MSVPELTQLHADLTRFLIEHATGRDTPTVNALQERIRRILGRAPYGK